MTDRERAEAFGRLAGYYMVRSRRPDGGLESIAGKAARFARASFHYAKGAMAVDDPEAFFRDIGNQPEQSPGATAKFDADVLAWAERRLSPEGIAVVRTWMSRPVHQRPMLDLSPYLALLDNVDLSANTLNLTVLDADRKDVDPGQ